MSGMRPKSPSCAPASKPLAPVRRARWCACVMPASMYHGANGAAASAPVNALNVTKRARAALRECIEARPQGCGGPASDEHLLVGNLHSIVS